MKRYLKIGLIGLVLAILGIGTFQISQTLSAKDALSVQLRHQPDLSVVRYVQHPEPDMLDNKPTVIVLFNPDCEHCQYEATQMRQHQTDFVRAGVYWLTTESAGRARAFARQFGLDSLPTMHVGTLTRDESYRLFGATGVPHLFIYGSDGQLRKEYKGEVKIEAVLRYL
jgi:hypothetical protein